MISLSSSKLSFILALMLGIVVASVGSIPAETDSESRGGDPCKCYTAKVACPEFCELGFWNTCRTGPAEYWCNENNNYPCGWDVPPACPIIEAIGVWCGDD